MERARILAMLACASVLAGAICSTFGDWSQRGTGVWLFLIAGVLAGRSIWEMYMVPPK